MISEAKTKSRLFKSYLVVAVVPAAIFLILGTISFLMSWRYISRELAGINWASLEQSRKAVESILQDSDAIILGMSTDPSFYSQADKVLSEPIQTIDDMRLYFSVLTTLKSAINVRPYLRSIYLFLPNSPNVIATSSDDVVPTAAFFDTDWIEPALERRDEIDRHIEVRTIEPYPGLGMCIRYLTIYRNMLSSAGFNFRGILVINIDMEYIERVLASHFRSGSGGVMLIDSAGQVAASVDEGRRRTDGEASYVSYETALEGYPFVIKARIPRIEYFRLPMSLGLISSVSTLIALVLGLAAAYALSKRSYGSIASIVDIIQAAERGDALPEPRIPNRDGYHDLIFSVLKSFVEQRYLKLQLSERDFRVRTMELLALQSQMNPHFLFNTLTGVSCKALAFAGGPNTMTETIDHLAFLMSYSLGNPERTVTINDEVAYAEHYVAIQADRYKDSFSVEWRIDPEVRPCGAAKLLLQPLIENAIYHGVREAAGKGHIVVEARLEGDDVLISVSDDGIGMAADRLAAVRASTASSDHPDAHIGLFNTARRLKLRYGEGVRIDIDSAPGKGTRVSLRYPSCGSLS